MVSIFKKVDQTATPIKSLSIPDALDIIKNSPSKELIELARKAGKKSAKDFQNGTLYLDFDEYFTTFRNKDVINKLKNIISDNYGNKIYFYTLKEELSVVDKLLKFYGLDGESIFISNFVEYFSNKINDPIAFLCVTWHSFDKIRQEKENKKGENSIDKRNLYDFIKCTKSPIVTWNAEFLGKRNLKSVNILSGFIYMDVDDFTKHTKEKVLSILQDNSLKFVKATWKSFGGDGIGFLIAIDNLTQENFKNTWIEYADKFYNDFGIKVDKATKDISRINVLSYDDNLFVRDEVIALPAILERKNVIEIKSSGIAEVLQPEILEQHLNYHYNAKGALNESEKRLTYYFYQNFFSKTNHLGIPIDNVMAFLHSKNDEFPFVLQNIKYSIQSIKEIAERQYSTYADQFGTFQIEDGQYNVSPDYVIVGLYQQYKGDKELKMQKLLHTIMQKEETEQGIIVKLALSAKRSGISTDDLISFVEEKFSYNPEFRIKIKSIYTNSKYPFGIVTVLKNDALKTKRESFINKQIDNGFRTIGLNENHWKTNDALVILNETYNLLISKFYRITDKTVGDFLTAFFRECNSYAIPLKKSINFINERSDFHSISRYATFYGKECYEFGQIYSGLRFIKEPIKKKVDLESIVNLNNSNKLSDLSLTMEDNHILWADTNMGKTTWCCTTGNKKKIVLVPTIGALKSIESKFNASAFYEAKKEVSPYDELIVCTYSSFPKLFNIIQSWEGKAKQYDLYFDEQHNLAVSAAKNYRNSELNFVMDNLAAFGRRFFMTGTYFPIEHPAIKEMKIQRIKWEVQPIKRAKLVFYEDKIKSVEKLLVRGKKNIVYLQDKKMHRQLGKLLEYLKQKNWDGIYLLNANEKNEPHFKNLISSEYLENDAQIIITTSVAVEALNILDLDVETIHFLTFENPRLMEQMVNRMRLRLPDMIYIYKKNKPIENIPNIDIIKCQKDLIEYAKQTIQFLSTPKQKKKDSYDLVSAQKLFANQIFEKSMLFRVKDKEWEVDYLAIAYKVFQEEISVCKNNLQYFESILVEYGWQFEQPIIDSCTLSTDEKKNFVEIKEQLKEEMENYSLGVLKTVTEEGIEKLKKDIELKTTFDNFKYPDLEWDIRIKVIKLSKYMEFKESCRLVQDWIINYKQAQSIFEKIIRQIAVQIAKLSGSLNSTIKIDTKFSQSVFALYNESKKENKIFSKQDIEELFNRRKRFHNVLKDLDGEKYAFQIFKRYFEIIPVLKNKKVCFQFGGLNPINDVSIFSNNFYDWAEFNMNTEISFTSIELCSIINEMRKSLPILSHFKVDNKQALTLCNDYFTMKKTTKRINGKPVNYYKIESLHPKLINDYEIKINQNVTLPINDELNNEILTNYYEKKNDTKQISNCSV